MKTPKWTYRCEYVRCNKVSCRSCPHGPYWYRYQRREGKLHKEYLGKERPTEEGPLPKTAPPPRTEDEYDRMLHKTTAGLHVALAVLRIPVSMPTHGDAFRAYRREQLQHHPDRGGELRKSQAINAAWSWLKAFFAWTSSYPS